MGVPCHSDAPHKSNALVRHLTEALRESRLTGFRKTVLHAKRTLLQRVCHLPRMITVEASSWCNLRCAFCPTRERKISDHRTQPYLSFNEFKQLIDDTAHFCSRLNFSLFGEPLANPQLPEMISYAEGKGIATTLFTNATLLTREKIRDLLDSGLTRVIASFESFEKDLYEATKCGADMTRTRHNIECLVQLRNELNLEKPQIVLRVVLTRKTRADMGPYLQKARELKVDAVSYKPLTVWPQGTEEYKKKMMGEYVVDHPVSRYSRDQEGHFTLRQRTRTCPSLYTPAVLSDGSVCLCWYDMLGESAVGNLKDQSFTSIWAKSQSFREQRMAAGNAYSLCRECPGIGAERDDTIWFNA